MGDEDSERISRALSMTMCLHPKLFSSPAPAGLLRLSPESALFLLPSSEKGVWLLEGRTWGDPQEEFVQQWHVFTAEAARTLDSTVPLPDVRRRPQPDLPTQTLGEAANKRYACFFRRLMRLQ